MLSIQAQDKLLCYVLEEEISCDEMVATVIVDYVVSDVEYIATPHPGKIIIVGNSGAGNNNDTNTGESSQQELPTGKDYVVTDKEGNVWHVDEEGNLTQGNKVAEGGVSTSVNTEGISGSGSNAQISQYSAKGVRVEWHETSDTRYAYDTADKHPVLKDKYPTVKDSEGNTVYVSYKAVVNRSEDSFGAKIIFDDEELKERKVIFKTLKIGQEIVAQEGSGNSYTLKLKGTMNYAEEDVIAVLMPKDSTQKQQLIGSFKLIHLESKTIDVALVPTDEISKAKLQSIKEETNAIYSKVGVTINFKEDAIFDITPYLNGRVLDFFDFSEEAVSPSELDDFIRLFKDEKRITQSQIKDILSELDIEKRAWLFRNAIKEKSVVESVSRQSWNGYVNIFRANADEIVEASNKINEYRIATGQIRGGNYGYLEGNINGIAVDNKLWRSISKANAQDEIHIFTAIEVEGNAGNSWLRITDSEYRMLNNLANELGGKPGNVYKQIKGELKIISENPYCNSCQGVIQQFHEMYPNVKLILIDSIK